MKKTFSIIALLIFGFYFSQTIVYENYRNSILSVNWNSLGLELNLTPAQRNQIVVLNNRYPTYESWYVVYKDRPDYWRRDRDREIRSILGETKYLKYKNEYYKCKYNQAIYYNGKNKWHKKGLKY